jgi:hypothetical protein
MKMIKTYWPELKDQKPDGEIEAEYGCAGKYNVKTCEMLTGRGIELREIINGDMISGLKRYLVTENALKRLGMVYSIAQALYLD